MASTSAEEAVLVVRIWREPGVTGFRGRVTYRADVSDTAEAVVVVDSGERLHAAVQDWLDAFMVQGRPQS
jgi:hypothetical protein